MARRNYRLEMLGACFLPFLLAVVDSAIVGVVVKNAYEPVVERRTLDFVVAMLTASTAFANIVSFVWVRASHGKDKIRFINILQAIMLVLVALIALAPRSEPGLWGIAAAVLAARFCWAGFVTIRSTIWRQNYSRRVRARITGKIAIVQTFMLALLGFGLGRALDEDPQLFRILLPIGCVLSAVGLWSWSRVRLRQGPALLAAERASADESDAPSINPVVMLRLLAADRPFAAYMLCMMLLGLGNLMQTPLLVVVLRDEFGMGYLGGIAVTNSIPLIMMPLSIPLWARLLDRTHVIRFRMIHSWSFVLASVLYALAVEFHEVWILHAASLALGVGFGGGVLAWNLGHLDFAPPHKASQYMGVHMTLNGVRGLAAPFLSVGVYHLLQPVTSRAAALAFWLCLAFCAAGAIGFQIMGRRMRVPLNRHGEPIEVAPPSRVQ